MYLIKITLQNNVFFRSFPALTWVAVITCLSLLPANDLPKTQLENIPHFDKLVHAGMYFILALLWIYPLQTTTIPAYFFILVFSFVLGGGLELLQHYLTRSRSGSWADLLADMAGAAGGLVVNRYFKKKRTNLNERSDLRNREIKSRQNGGTREQGSERTKSNQNWRS